MNQEEYKKSLDRAVRLAHEGRNHITEEEYAKIFSPLDLSPEQDALTRNYLKELHISFGEAPEEKDEDEGPELFNEEDGTYLRIYLEELASLPCHTEDEIDDIYKKALSDDDYGDARKELINIHLKNVVDIAKLYVYHGMSIEDLIGEGNIGLMMAVDLLGTVETREEAEGLIGKTIMDSMDAAIKADLSLKEDMDGMLELINKVAKEVKELSKDLKRDVTAAELTENTELTFEEILKAAELTGYNIPGLKSGQ